MRHFLKKYPITLNLVCGDVKYKTSNLKQEKIRLLGSVSRALAKELFTLIPTFIQISRNDKSLIKLIITLINLKFSSLIAVYTTHTKDNLKREPQEHHMLF